MQTEILIPGDKIAMVSAIFRNALQVNASVVAHTEEELKLRVGRLLLEVNEFIGSVAYGEIINLSLDGKADIKVTKDNKPPQPGDELAIQIPGVKGQFAFIGKIV